MICPLTPVLETRAHFSPLILSHSQVWFYFRAGETNAQTLNYISSLCTHMPSSHAGLRVHPECLIDRMWPQGVIILRQEVSNCLTTSTSQQDPVLGRTDDGNERPREYEFIFVQFRWFADLWDKIKWNNKFWSAGTQTNKGNGSKERSKEKNREKRSIRGKHSMG